MLISLAISFGSCAGAQKKSRQQRCECEKNNTFHLVNNWVNKSVKEIPKELAGKIQTIVGETKVISGYCFS